MDEEKYAKRRMETNKILMLKGIEIDDGGNFRTVRKAQGVSEVTRRTRELRQKLYGYGAHQYVLQCCKEELLAEDYFHAVQEAAKSLCDRVREMTGLPEDGNELRIRWDIDETAAVEVLQQISFLHKYLDQCIVVKKYV